jgi:hypothetical protein
MGSLMQGAIASSLLGNRWQFMLIRAGLSTLISSGVGYEVAKHLIKDFASLVWESLFGSSQKSVSKKQQDLLDDAVAAYSKKGGKILSNQNWVHSLSKANVAILVLLTSMISLYFQYIGMNIMRKENELFQKITSNLHMDNSGDYDFNSWFKKKIMSFYETSDFYNSLEDQSVWSTDLFNVIKYHPVRMAYNTLVGINYALFYCLQGRSDDPSREIIHWTKILLYWEILARLIKHNGFAPVHLATRLLLYNLTKKSASSKRRS